MSLKNTDNPNRMASRMRHLASAENSLFFIKRLDTTNLASASFRPTLPIHIPLHSFIYLLSGKIIIGMGEKVILLQSGDGMIMPAGGSFSIRFYEDCKGYMGAFRHDNVAISDYKPIHFPFRRRALVDALMERLSEDSPETVASVRASGESVQCCLDLFIAEANEAGTMHGFGEEVSSTSNVLSNRFIDMVFDNYAKGLSVEEYASALCVSPSQLYKTVRKHTGHTPLEWITDAVMSEAKILLSNTEKSISEISSSLGILDSSYFSRLFKRYSGMTPSEYRKSTEKS